MSRQSGYTPRQERGDSPLTAQDSRDATRIRPIRVNSGELLSIVQVSQQQVDVALSSMAIPRDVMQEPFRPEPARQAPIVNQVSASDMIAENDRRTRARIYESMPWRSQNYSIIKLPHSIGTQSDPLLWPGVNVTTGLFGPLVPGTIAISRRAIQRLSGNRQPSHEYRIDVYLGWLLWHPITAGTIVGETAVRQLLIEYMVMTDHALIDNVCSAAIVELEISMNLPDNSEEEIAELQRAVSHYRRCWHSTRATNPLYTRDMIAAAVNPQQRDILDAWSSVLQSKSLLQLFTLMLQRQQPHERVAILQHAAQAVGIGNLIQTVEAEQMTPSAVSQLSAASLVRPGGRVTRAPRQRAPLPDIFDELTAVTETPINESEEVQPGIQQVSDNRPRLRPVRIRRD